MKQDKMIICPKAKWCLKHRPECHIPIRCPHVDKHKIIIERGKDCCNNPTELCPACIPVEPKQQCTDSRSLEDIEQCCGEQPTPTMPLREQLGRLLCEIDNAGCLRINACNPLNCPLTKSCLDALESAVEAHDSAIASKAVKEFATDAVEQLQGIIDYPSIGNPRRTEDGYPLEISYDEFAYKRLVDSYRVAVESAIAHIRAMAGGQK